MFNLKDSNINLDNLLIPTKGSAVDRNKYKTIIPITSDCMFKTLFGREEYIKFPCKLLSYIIDMSYEELLKNLKFTKNETGKRSKKERSYRNDLVVIVGDTSINIEMNNNASEEVRDRNFDYLMRIRNDKKDRRYTPVIQININNFSYLNDEVVRRDYAVMDNDKVLFTNKIIIIDIYLPNIKKKSYNKDNLSEMERFLLIGIEEDRKKALEYVGDDIVMNDFEKLIEEKSLDDDLYEAYDKEWALKDQALRDGMEKGIEQGIVQGIEQGSKNKQREMIIEMLNKGAFISEISYLTSVSEEYIENIIEEEHIDYKEEAYDKEWALKDQALRDGMEKGIEQGIEQKQAEIVTNRLSKGVSPEYISEITGISIDYINNINNKNTN